MNGLLKSALAVGGGAAAAEVLRRSLWPIHKSRDEQWEKLTFKDLRIGLLILCERFA